MMLRDVINFYKKIAVIVIMVLFLAPLICNILTVSAMQSGNNSDSVIYDRNKVYNFAQFYWNKTVPDGYYWTSSSVMTYYGDGAPAPTNVTGDDCAHFVSNCIGNNTGIGGVGGGLNVPQDIAKCYGIVGAQRLVTWITTPANNIGVSVSSVNNLSKGDVIGYDWGTGSIGHTAVYLGNFQVAAHSNCHWAANWTLGGASKYAFCHITVPSAVPEIIIPIFVFFAVILTIILIYKRTRI